MKQNLQASGPDVRRTRFVAVAALISIAFVASVGGPALGQSCATPALGCWTQLPNPEVTSVNGIALKTGKVMVQNRGFVGGEQFYQLFDPVTNTFSPSPPARATVSHNMYCSGFDQTGEDGSVLFAGGLSGADLQRASVYDPDTDSWTAKPDMVALRFYPTVLTLSRRHVLALDGSGSVESNIPERYSIRNMVWDSLFRAEYGSTEPPPNNFELPNYPRFHVLSTGELIYTGSEQFVPAGGEFTRLFDPVFETWRQPFPLPDPIIGESGVLYERDTIMKAGPTQTWTLEATTPGAQWTQRASLNQTRDHFFTVALPDGKVLAVGDLVTPEIYDPEADTWTSMAPASQARGDHSAAVLLADGRVLHAGPTATAEVYSPPYLFRADGSLARRPAITDVTGPATGVVQYGEAFKLTSRNAALLDEIRLIRLGAASHSWDMGQQSMTLDFAPTCCDPDKKPGFDGNLACIEGVTCCASGKWKCNKGDGSPDCLDIVSQEAQSVQGEPLESSLQVEAEPLFNVCGSLEVEAPQHPYQSPPGYHYLFVVRDGVPSRAAIVQLVVVP